MVLATLAGSLLAQQAHAATGEAKPTQPTVADPWNSRLSVDVGADGRYSVGAFPDPSTGDPTTGSFKLLYGWPNTGTTYSTLRLDGADAILGQDAPVAAGPIDSGDTDTTTFADGAVTTTQTLSLVTNPQTGQADAVRIAYRVTNGDTVSHEIGVRAMLDTDVNDNDGAPFRVPGIGAVTTEQDLSGSAVPDTFQVFQDLSDSSHIASATLRGAEATPPDRLVVAAWPSIYGSPWDYTTTAGQPITNDSAYATYWNPQALAGGSSRTYVTYYGLANVTVDLTPPIALGLTGPASLTAAGSSYSPNPFSVVATVSDDGTALVNGATISLSLPAGLHTSDPTTVSLGTLNPGDPEQLITWHVTADPQASATTLTYSVTASGSNTGSKTLSRQIAVPALVPASCPTLQFFGVRGSGEQAAFGLTVGNLAAKLAYNVSQMGITMRPTPIEYQAVPVLYDGPFWYSTTYQNSELEGEAALQTALLTFWNHCSKTYVVLAGYSQGAHVVGNVVEQMSRSPADLKRIAAVVLFGDPKFNPKTASLDCCSKYYPYSKDIGIYSRAKRLATGILELRSLPSKVTAKSYCTSGDPICNATYSNTVGCLTFPDLCPHIKYVERKYTDDAAWWITKQLKTLKL
jgi:hypothetical protein